MFSLLCFLTGIGCATTPPLPAVEPEPGAPIVVSSAADATDREAQRSAAIVEAARTDSDRIVAERKQLEDTEREKSIQAHQERTAARRNGPSRPGFWNPSKGEKPSDKVVPPPARHCRTVVAAETQGRLITVRQSDGSYRVGVEPVVTGTQPLEVCDPPSSLPR